MKKEVVITYIIGVFVIAIVFCMIIGPMTWLNSYSHYSKLEDFETNGKKTIATITGRFSPSGLERSRVRSYYLDLVYENENSQLVNVEDISVKRHIYNSVNFEDQVEVYYKINENNKPDAILLMSYDIDTVPMSIHPYWGKWITILSFGLFIFGIGLLVRLRIKNKPTPYIKQDVNYSRDKKYSRKKNPLQ